MGVGDRLRRREWDRHRYVDGGDRKTKRDKEILGRREGEREAGREGGREGRTEGVGYVWGDSDCALWYLSVTI